MEAFRRKWEGEGMGWSYLTINRVVYRVLMNHIYEFYNFEFKFQELKNGQSKIKFKISPMLSTRSSQFTTFWPYQRRTFLKMLLSVLAPFRFVFFKFKVFFNVMFRLKSRRILSSTFYLLKAIRTQVIELFSK